MSQHAAHTAECQLRWSALTWLTTTLVCGVYPLILAEGDPTRSNFQELVVGIVVLAVGTSLVSVFLLARVKYLGIILVPSILTGFCLGYALAAKTYGTGGDSLDGLMFRAAGGAIVGVVSAFAAWATRKALHRTDVNVRNCQLGRVN